MPKSKRWHSRGLGVLCLGFRVFWQPFRGLGTRVVGWFGGCLVIRIPVTKAAESSHYGSKLQSRSENPIPEAHGKLMGTPGKMENPDVSLHGESSTETMFEKVDHAALARETLLAQHVASSFVKDLETSVGSFKVVFLKPRRLPFQGLISKATPVTARLDCLCVKQLGLPALSSTPSSQSAGKAPHWKGSLCSWEQSSMPSPSAKI